MKTDKIVINQTQFDPYAFYFNGKLVKELNIEDLVSGSNSYINVNVHGYWSDVINIRVSRNSFENKWEISVSHSSGGRLEKNDNTYKIEDGYYGVASDIIAERNFGKALIAATELAEQIENIVPQLEEIYQEKEKQAVEEYKKKQAEKLAKFEKDKPFSEKEAKNIMLKMKTNKSMFAAVIRGEEKPTYWLYAKDTGSQVRFYKTFSKDFETGNAISSKEVFKLLTEMLSAEKSK